MVINFQLDKNDFLEYQIYMVGQMPKVRRMRMKKRITFPVIFLLFGLFFLTIKMKWAAMLSWFLALVWFTFYPVFHARKYNKYYQKFVEENYGHRFGKQVSIDILEDKIIGNDNGFEIKIKWSEIEEIVEIKHLILIKLNDKQHMIIAKEKLEEIERLKILLSRLANRWQLTFRT